MPPTEAEVRELVRRILSQLLGPGAEASAGSGPDRPPSGATSGTTSARLIDEAALRDLPSGSTLEIPAGALITPLARQIALEKQITLAEQHPNLTASTGTSRPDRAPAERRIAIGADHGGYTLKETLKTYLQAQGYQVVDCGTHGTESVDYPDFAYAVARLVADGKCANGVIVDGAGIGSCMAANKVPGVRAAMAYDHATAVNSREHNHANVLTLGAGLVGPALAKQIVAAWLSTPYGGGRHARRVDKIMAIEKRYLRG